MTSESGPDWRFEPDWRYTGAPSRSNRGMRQRGIVALHDSERASQRRGYSRLTRVRKARSP
jgi:hypothetical protein